MNFDKIKTGFVKHSPLIAISGAGVGYVGTILLAIRATNKATKKVEEVKKTLPEGQKLSKKEILKLTYKYYIPTLSLGIGSTVLLCYAGTTYEKRNRAAIAACAISENAFRELKSAVEEKLDEKQLEEVYDKVGKNKIEQVAEKEPQELSPEVGPDGKYWIIEPIGNHKFRSTKDQVKDTLAQLNLEMSTDPFGSFLPVEDYCDALGAEAPDFDRKIGWDTKHGLIDAYIGSDTIDGVNYYVIVHRNPPRWYKE